LSSNLDTSSNLAGQYNYDYVVASSICPNDTSNVIVIVDGSCDYTAFVAELAGQWEVYPNPASSILSIVNNSGLNISSLEVLDMNGKIVMASQAINHLQTDLDVSQLQIGIYLIQLTIDEQTMTKRFIKQ